MIRALGILVLLGSSAPASSQVRFDLAGAEGERFGEVGDFAFVDAEGRTVTRDDLLGEPWVGMLFFTRCAGPCPRLVADTRTLLAPLIEDTDVRILSFSVDPAHDTPEVLAEYAARYTVDPERWSFLTGDEDQMHRFVREGLRLAVQGPRLHAGGDEDDQAGDARARLAERLDITHATRLVAVDGEGRIAGWYEVGADERSTRAEIEASFARLVSRMRHLDGRARPEPSPLPLINASLNGAAFLLLVWGLLAIRAGKRDLHGGLMLAAFAVSAAFLACYLYYHFVVLPLSGGPTRYNGAGWTKVAYLALLASHVILAVVNLPMVLRTLWLARRRDWVRHRRMARWTLPIWMYVSVTGVLVYVVLYHLNPDLAA